MTSYTASPWQTLDWQQSMKSMTRDLGSLCQALDIEIDDLPLAHQAAEDFALKVPQSFIKRMQKGNASDPLLLQVLPQAAETLDSALYTQDPLQESEFNPVPGLIHPDPSTGRRRSLISANDPTYMKLYSVEETPWLHQMRLLSN